MNIVQMTSILINSVLTEQVLEQQEAVIVLVRSAWCIVEDTNIGIDHFVITNKEECWNEDWFLGVGSWNTSFGGHRMECLFNQVNDLFVAYITRRYNDHILAIVIVRLILSQIVDADGRNVIAITLDRLSNHVLSESIEV